MSAIILVARQRLTCATWRVLVVAGVLLGVGFGLCLASLAAARRTASAYDRILTRADAADATVSLSQGPEAGEQALRGIDGITRQRVYAGFVGSADGIEPVLTTVLLAPVRNTFPLDLPTMQAGRLPRPGAADEAFVNTDTAKRGGLAVGDRVHFRFSQVSSPTEVVPDADEADVTIVGIGTLPAEAAADQTSILGLWVFSRAFFDEHRAVVVYAASNVYLAPGFDARRDLAPAIGAARRHAPVGANQERQATNDALHPMLIVLVSIAVLAFGAASVAAAQVVQRNRERWLVDSERLRTLGMAREQIRMVELVDLGRDRRGRGRDRARHDVARVADRADWPLARPRPRAGLRCRRDHRRRRRGGDRRDARAAHARLLDGPSARTATGTSPLARSRRSLPASRRRPGSPSRCVPTTAAEAAGVGSPRRPLRRPCSRCARCSLRPPSC